MGNGALPNGPSYRAHPRLYQRYPHRCFEFTSGFGALRHGRVVPAVSVATDPMWSFDIFAIKFIQLDSHPRAPSTRKGTLTEVEMTHWPETLRALAEADDPRLPKTAEVAMHTR